MDNKQLKQLKKITDAVNRENLLLQKTKESHDKLKKDMSLNEEEK